LKNSRRKRDELTEKLREGNTQLKRRLLTLATYDKLQEGITWRREGNQLIIPKVMVSIDSFVKQYHETTSGVSKEWVAKSLKSSRTDQKVGIKCRAR